MTRQELGNLHLQPGTCRCTHQVQRLYRAGKFVAAARQAVNRPFAYLTVGIHHNYNLGRSLSQVAHAEVQCIPFAAQPRIVALYHFGTSLVCQLGRVVRAVVRHYQQAIAVQQLRRNAGQHRTNDQRLIVGGHQHRHSRALTNAVGPRPRWQARQQHLQHQDQHRYQDDDRQQAQ